MLNVRIAFFLTEEEAKTFFRAIDGQRHEICIKVICHTQKKGTQPTGHRFRDSSDLDINSSAVNQALWDPLFG